ncbi:MULTISPECIES: response regulator [Delftia]|uniref:Two component transcriptional regulator, LuxR family n=4 Tax=Delftia TaxID=80865 RepID=A9BQ82_DELAS|nr:MULTISPECIES: response regulator transcription factor [Delftia]MBA4005928.1 DNA-binding response regulator [Delftia sp.]OLE92275.1 MAG: DNA-binding response regulator [Delftia sp. 13_1_40CM_3_66_6]PIF34865.1 LuxR family two component transcriptional regulator [Burkholderiales bacterium 23]ABX33297.1 two component transcriptional regulator, LuxR family [Delftia acidovorans SPH-1]AEF87628.1 two component transcriptional regulator, LuxR family [Delftia sp. Cs1-4]
MIHVVLCDDHAVLRRGIRDTLAEAVDISVTAEAGSYAELREQLRTATCDVLLLDINMPGRSGLEALASVRETHPLIKVLMVSMYPEDQYALRCLKAGAQGYANKAGDPVLLIEAVRTVATGRKYLTSEVAQMLADSLAQPAPQVPHESLSERELQTLIKIAAGQRLTDIATELMLSPKTVSVYRARVLEKLQMSSNAELTAYAIHNQLI